MELGWVTGVVPSKPLAAFLLPDLTVIYGLRTYFSFSAEDSVGEVGMRLVGLAVLGLHVFLLVDAA